MLIGFVTRETGRRRAAAALAGLGMLLVLISAATARADEAAPPAYARLLERYVTARGVRFGAWHQTEADRASLQDVVAFYAKGPVPRSRDGQLAWHLNAYNAWILHQVLDMFPVAGPLEKDPHFFKSKRIEVNGSRMSFDHLEHAIIRREFREPRIHFALNCASASCPPLGRDPFAPETLDRQLDRVTRAFFNDSRRGVAIAGDRVQVSRLFEWFAEDFGGADGMVPFINRYRTKPLPTGVQVGFLEYSWRLNEDRSR